MNRRPYSAPGITRSTIPAWAGIAPCEYCSLTSCGGRRCQRRFRAINCLDPRPVAVIRAERDRRRSQFNQEHPL